MTRVVAVLVFDQVKLLDVAGPVEVFAEANRHGADYELQVVSVDGQDATSSAGVVLGVHSDVLTAVSTPIDTALVAGADVLTTRPIDDEIVSAAAELAAVARRTCSICTGAFILAKAGLLDRKRATTHWSAAPMLARSHPSIQVESDSIFVQDGDVFTSAGVTAGIDLALALVERDLGPDLARTVAQGLVVFMQRPGGQSQFSPALEAPRATAPGLQALVNVIVANPADDHSLEQLAQRVAVSPRHLRRMFHDELSTTPVRFGESVRVDAAKRLLITGTSVSAAARQSGFGSAESLRRLFPHESGSHPARTGIVSARPSARPARGYQSSSSPTSTLPVSRGTTRLSPSQTRYRPWGQHPTKIDKRKLRKVELHHVAWSQVLADAVMQKEFRGVADQDQAWILGELIQYLEHRKSGALEFDDMGEAWVVVRDSVAAGTYLRPSDKGVTEVISRFDAMLRFASLQLGRQLSAEVIPLLTRKELTDPASGDL